MIKKTKEELKKAVDEMTFLSFVDDSIISYREIRKIFLELAFYELPPYEYFSENKNGCYLGGVVDSGQLVFTFHVTSDIDEEAIIDMLNNNLAQQQHPRNHWIYADSVVYINDNMIEIRLLSCSSEESALYMLLHSRDEHLVYEKEARKQQWKGLLNYMGKGYIHPLPY